MPDPFTSKDEAPTPPLRSHHPRFEYHAPPARATLVTPRMSVNQITTYRWGFDEDLVHYQRAGVESVGVWRPKLEEYGEERAIDLLHDTGLDVSSLSWVGGFTGQHGYAFDDAVREARETLELASRMKADCVVMLSGARAGHTFNHARRLLIDALRQLADDAADAGVALAVQPMMELFSQKWSFVETLDETLGILDACRHRSVGLAFDVYHLWQEDNLLSRIREVARRTKIVQLNDWHRDPQSEYDRALIGDGEIPLRDIIEAFLMGGYTGDFEISVWSEELWKADYEELLSQCQSRFDALV